MEHKVASNVIDLERTCPACSQHVPPTGNFCTHCGASLDAVDAQEPEAIPLRSLFEELPGREITPCLLRGALVISSVAAAVFLVSRFLAANGSAWGTGLGAGLAIALVASHWLAAMQVAYSRREDRPWPAVADVIHQMPIAAALVAAPLSLAWGVVGPLAPAHRYMLGRGPAALLTWAPMGACMLLTAFACAHYVRVQTWRGVLSGRAFLETVARCGIGSLAVVLCVAVGVVAWLPAAAVAAAYAGSVFWRDEGAIADHEPAGGVRGVAEAVATRLSAYMFRRWADDAESDHIARKGRAAGLALTVMAAFAASAVVLPYCLVVVVGRLAAAACSGHRIRFWPDEHQEAEATPETRSGEPPHPKAPEPDRAAS